MLDSLDLEKIRSYLVSSKKTSRVMRTLSLTAIFLLVGAVASVILLSKPSDSTGCTCTFVVNLFCLAVPAGIVLGVAALYYGRWARRHAQRILKLDPIDLSSLELPEPINMAAGKGNFLIIGWMGLWLIVAIITQMNVLVAIFIMFVPSIAFSIRLGVWIRTPMRAGDYDETKRRSRLVQEWFQGDRTALNLEGLALLFSGDSSESERVHRQLIAQSIRYPNLKMRGLSLNNLAVELMFQGRYEEALSCLETGIYLQPQFSSAYNSLGEWYLLQNLSPERALELVTFGLDLTSPAQKASQKLKMASRAWAEARLGRGETAKTTLAQALNFSDPKNIPAYAELNRIAGETYIALGDTDKAHGHFQKAAEIDPKGRIGKLALERLQIDQK
jgi:tetratricopeptide (TPR) repeat protein